MNETPGRWKKYLGHTCLTVRSIYMLSTRFFHITHVVFSRRESESESFSVKRRISVVRPSLIICTLYPILKRIVNGKMIFFFFFEIQQHIIMLKMHRVIGSIKTEKISNEDLSSQTTPPDTLPERKMYQMGEIIDFGKKDIIANCAVLQ